MKWIKYINKMPIKSKPGLKAEKFLVYLKRGITLFSIYIYDDDKWIDSDNVTCYFEDVTHWMKLPIPKV